MPLEAILVRLVGIHRRFIARCYRRGCPAATPDCMHNSVMAAGFVKRRRPRRVRQATGYIARQPKGRTLSGGVLLRRLLL
jgi:hypothetical protein